MAASDALELCLLAHRYMIEPLVAEGRNLLSAALQAADVVPLLLRTQQDGGEALGMCTLILEWAVEHYEEVHSQISHWIECAPSARPPAARALGEHSLRGLLDSLRAATVRHRHGL